MPGAELAVQVSLLEAAAGAEQGGAEPARLQRVELSLDPALDAATRRARCCRGCAGCPQTPAVEPGRDRFGQVGERVAVALGMRDGEAGAVEQAQQALPVVSAVVPHPDVAGV